MPTQRSVHFRRISKELCYLALPMMITQLITIGSGFAAMMMLSALGHDVLAASALIFSIRISLLITCSSILFSLSVLIGHAFGQKEYLRIGNFMQQGWALGILISLPMMLVFWNIGSILLYLGQSKTLVQIVETFFHANVWNVLPFLLAVSNQQLCYGTRKQTIDLIGNLIGIIILLSSSYLLIFGNLGFPALEVKGFAYALDLQGWSYFFFTSIVIITNKFFKKFELFTYRFHRSFLDFIQMLKIGWPIAMQIGGEMLSFFVSATFVGWLGISSLAAYQVVTQYLFLVMVPLFALSQASGIMIGEARGEKNTLKIKQVGNAAVLFSLTITAIFAIICMGFPKYLASFYFDVNNSLNQETLQFVILLFAVCVLQQLFDAVRNVLTGSLRGLFDTRYPMFIGLSAIWLIGIPVGYLLAFHYHLGVVGIIIGSTIGMLIGMLFLTYRWRQQTLEAKLSLHSRVGTSG